MSQLRSRGSRGFTLVELVVSLLVVVVVLVAVLTLFDFTSKVASVQTNVADMQQSLRTAQSEIERVVRMAGRGGIPMSTSLPLGSAVWVLDNVAAGTKIAGGSSPDVVPGSDVLIVRGVFSAPIYQINSLGLGVFTLRDASGNPTLNPALAVTGTILVGAVSPTSINQNLQALADAVSQGIPEALVLVSARNRDVFAVVELVPATSTVDVSSQASIDFRIQNSVTSDAYRALAGGAFPATLTSVGFLGILEEHRFYVRPTLGGGSDAAPALTRARVLPNTQVAYGPAGNPGNGANLAIDLADNILDLQVALALDTPNHVPRPLPPGAPAEPAGLTTIDADPVNGYISEAGDGVDDDWLFNSTNDSAANPVWTGARLCYVRLNLVARTDRRDTSFEAPPLGQIEDRLYASNDPMNLAQTAGGSQRMFRRRVLRTTINVRNL